MTKRKKIILGVVISFLVVSLLIGGICWWQLNSYYDKNSWAWIRVFEDDEDVEFAVAERNEDELYLKGDTIPVAFAEVKVDKVKYPGRVTLSSDADILFHDEISHKVTLEDGEYCVISKGDDSVTVVMYDCYFQ
ncbi:MAG: hypothetical protein J5685_04105 [Clostridiales bacterium]|nr:hypothetical protein [Clostridiales bacterium]